MIYISHRGCNLIDWCQTKSKYINYLNEFRSDIENSLCKVSRCFFTSIVRLSSFNSHKSWLTMIQIIFVHKAIYTNKIWNWLEAHCELMVKCFKFCFILRTLNFTIHVNILLKDEKKDKLTRNSIVLIIENKFCCFSNRIYSWGDILVID